MTYVVTSELVVPPGSGQVLEDAFANRLGEVEGHDGFQKLEVWRDNHAPDHYLMVTWWQDEESFRSYMRSAEHRRSHERIPTDPHRPRGVSVSRWEVVAR